MSESKIEPEAQPSTSQNENTQKTAVIPLVSMPKVVLTRLDLNNLPIPVNKSTSSPAKKLVKRLTGKNNESPMSKSVSVKTPINIEQERSQRSRRGPRNDYRKLASLGMFRDEGTKTTTSTGKVSGIVKKANKSISIEEDSSVKGMLKKTMLQKRSKIAIPPPKKTKLMSSKENLSSSKPKKDLTKAVSPMINKDVSSILKNTISQMDTDASEDEFLYDELIDELVNPSNKKPLGTEKTTNITLKPNVGNKPPTIVKGGIVKKSSLPPDLKSVSSPTTLNSSKLTGAVFYSKVQSPTSENTIKPPATAETPKASLPTKASPFPISLSSSSTKIEQRGKRGSNKSANETTVRDSQPLNLNKHASTSTQITHKLKSVTPAPKPRGRPRIGPKQTVITSPLVSAVADDESDEYTDIVTLEPDSEPLEMPTNNNNDKNNDVQVITQVSSNTSNDHSADRPEADPTKDTDPHLDLLRILTGDTDETSGDSGASKGISENPQGSSSEDAKKHENTTSNISSSERTNDVSTNNSEQEANTVHTLPADESVKELLPGEEKNVKSVNKVKEPPVKTVIEEISPVRTVYDLMNDVSLKYPSWNLHIIPETNAFCIAQVTKGRLGLPTLKKCIELDAETYSAKVYIHQYHIKRFDGVYESEEAILALIEEIHSIKA